MTRAVTFDVFYTLLADEAPTETRDVRARTVVQVLKDCGEARARSAVDRALQRVETVREEWWSSTRAHLTTTAAVSLMCSELSASERARESLIERLSALTPESVRVAHGALESLGRLKRAGVRLGVASNVGYMSSSELRALLAREQLLDHFEPSAVVSSDVVGFHKPHPLIFQRATRALRSQPSEMTHVGDSQETDVLGAIKAGCRAVLATWFRDEPSVDGIPKVQRAGSISEAVDLILEEEAYVT